MPSNVELRRRIRKKSGELGFKAPDLKGLTNAQLQTLLSSLKPAAPDVEDEPVPEKKYIVGVKSLILKGRMFSSGDEITPDNVAGGDEAFQALITRGLIDES